MQTEQLTARRATAITAVLGLLSIFPPLATDMYLSAMGDLAAAMHAEQSAAELSLSIFFLGLCLGQLMMGPLIDGYGRKGPLLAGTALFAVTSLILPTLHDIAVFNGLRFLQAIGASVGMVVGRAVVNDLYEGQRAAKAMTVLVMLLTIGPIVSPTLGSLLLEAFGWRSIFVFMAGVSLLALGLSLSLVPETLPKARRTARPFRSGMRTAAALLSRREFLRAALVAGLVQGGMFAFITGSSGVFQGVYGLSSLAYGLVFALIAAALVLFGQINNLLLDSYPPAQILRRGLPVFGLLTLALVLVSGRSPVWLFVPLLWGAVGMIGLLSANAMTLAMSEARDGAGMGSAVLGAIQFGIAFTVSGCVALGGTGTPLPMSLGLLLPAILALGLSLVGRRRPEGGMPDAGDAQPPSA
ncbi:multidrug effflux MFS transporter [Alloyangia pacifica]|uniref:Bcr/CflA family efflux transporter n=1 Tax=Alloyangia pacifica TaxID=311180 RepID=A0A1I6RF62_9RHOB|nr:multidrug effflux MFS transporter [Alloyangia pacifica]SDG48863.1 MFS transporter, DHA1 family, bicyclomycin/chloramphenicol resistance protein [Alloyangia pacifica]SFS63397.1 MFS transporter, DHA1 family, bicyclomycin/chloramphenicol resistance protein [Alloyangia pacifica]